MAHGRTLELVLRCRQLCEGFDPIGNPRLIVDTDFEIKAFCVQLPGSLKISCQPLQVSQALQAPGRVPLIVFRTGEGQAMDMQKAIRYALER